MFHKLNYFSRLFIFCLLLGALPVAVTGVLSYEIASASVQNKVSEGNLQILLQTQSRVEQELKTIDHMTVQFLDSPLISGLLKRDLTPVDFGSVQDVLKNMYLMQTFEFGIADILLANTDYNWLVNKDGLHRISDYKAPSDTAVELDKYRQMNVSSKWTQDRRYVIMAKKWPAHAANPNGVLAVYIPQHDLNQMIAGNPELGEFMIIDRENRTIAQSRPQTDMPEEQKAMYMRQVRETDESQGHFSIRVGQREEEVAFRKSDYNGWVFLSIANRKDLTREATSIGWVTFWICSILIGLTLGGSWLGTRKIYSPIRRLVDTMKSTGNAPLSRLFADEFHFVTDGISTLLKSQSELRGQLDVQLRQWEALFMIKLLRGELCSKEIEEHWARFSYPPGERQYAVLTLQIDTLKNTRYREQDRNLLLYAINNIAGEIIPREERLSPIVMDQLQVTVLCLPSTEKEFKLEAFRCAGILQLTAREQLGLTVSIGISRTHDCAGDIAASYTEAAEALKYRFRLGEDMIIHIEDINPELSSTALFPIQIAEGLYDAVRSGDIDLTAVQLHEFLEQLTRANLTTQEFQMMLIRLLVELLRIAPDLRDIRAGKQDDKPLLEQLTCLHLISDIEQWFLQTIIHPLIQYLESRREFQYEKISAEIIELIHRRFDTDFSLEVCAAELNYHPSYIKRVFRKGTGMNFSDYLTQYRMKMAKMWIMETDMRISDIAERLCYSNVQNFIRQFRKTEGVTPGQYRKIINSGDDSLKN